MRWIRFEHRGRPHLGISTGEGIRDLTSVAQHLAAPDTVAQALASGDLVAWIRATVDVTPPLDAWLEVAPLRSPAEVRILPPIPNPPKNILCIGRNYRAHVEESARFRGQAVEVPQDPIIFTKPATAIIGPEDEIRLDPRLTQQLDYEGELAVVIGRQGRDIPKEAALDYVFGYTLLNDVTARDLQARHKQFFRGKGLDTFAPLGPVVVQRSALPDPTALELRTYVNGELRQRARVSDMIFDIPTLIHVLSSGMTLQPGDILATGTPDGVGAGFDPPRFLSDGDWIEITADPIGVLRNRVRSIR